jgi:hypothetical protein
MKAVAIAAALLVSGCATLATPSTDPQDAFFSRLTALCGRAFEGRIASPPVELDSSFAGKRLVMHVRDCSADEIKIPFHVGDNRSRTWVITRTASGLRLKHDHRHEDGSEDVLTQYGGDTATPGTARRQEFPVDRFSIDLFNRNDAAVSTTNVWAMEVEPGQLFAYELRRASRFFRVDFDLTRPVAAPPPPWGTR